jgi:muramidase (phage lysozyme)
MTRFALSLLLAATATLGCSAAPDEEVVGYEEESAEHQSGVTGVVEEGTVLRVTASQLNLRQGPSTGTTILDVLAEGDLVTVAEDSGAGGWIRVTTGTGEDGWVSAKYVVIESTGGGGGGSTETCHPDRAEGVINDFQKGLHDSIAWAEGTRGFAKDGYNVMFSFKLFSSCQKHPNQCIDSGSNCSTAAGRYQFLNKTWSSVKAAKGLTSFEPENQERGASYLVTTVRKVTVPSNRAMTAAEFSNAMSKLSWEWASLPPGRYGQPNKTQSQMRTMYCNLVGC